MRVSTGALQPTAPRVAHGFHTGPHGSTPHGVHTGSTRGAACWGLWPLPKCFVTWNAVRTVVPNPAPAALLAALDLYHALRPGRPVWPGVWLARACPFGVTGRVTGCDRA